MNNKILLALLVSIATTPVLGTIYCGMTKQANEIPLWQEQGPTYETGNSLYAECTGNGLADCRGYITGVADVLALQNANGMCLPKGVVKGQLVDVVKKHLTDHPEARHYTAISEIVIALTDAFPCKVPS